MMDKELIDRLALEVDISDPRPYLEKFASLIAEECAQAVLRYDLAQCDSGFGPSVNDLAEAIREKFKP